MSRRKAKFNFLDALLILAVIALVAGAIWRKELSDRIDTENIENTVTVCCEFEVPRDDRDVCEIKFGEGRTAVYLGEKEAGYVEVLPRPDSSASDESADESKEESADKSEAKSKNKNEAKSKDKSDIGGETEDRTGDEAKTVREPRLCLKVVSREDGYYIDGETKLLEGVEYRLNTKTTEFTALILSVKEEQNK